MCLFYILWILRTFKPINIHSFTYKKKLNTWSIHITPQPGITTNSTSAPYCRETGTDRTAVSTHVSFPLGGFASLEQCCVRRVHSCVPVAVFVWESEAFRPGSDKGSTCSPDVYGCIIYAYRGTALENNAFGFFFELLTKTLLKTVDPVEPRSRTCRNVRF